MAHITLSKQNFFYNLDKITQQTKSKEKIALVLKDNAYGHGLLEMASLAKEYGITKAVVQLNSEALLIEDFFEYILVLADTPNASSAKIRYTINALNMIEKFPKDTLVELKVNTGMNRNGIEIDELQLAFEMIEKQGLNLEAVFTHHACADELTPMYKKQCEAFEKVKQNSPSGLRFHSCNSAALFRSDDFSEDMARVGIAAYGCLELPSEISEVALRPVLSLYAKKVSTRKVLKGESVGYGASFSALEDTVVSNYDVGYGDGFLRTLSNTYQTPEGVKIAGRISMDNSSFIAQQEELLIFNDATKVSQQIDTISYEVLTSLKASLKRQIKE